MYRWIVRKISSKQLYQLVAVIDYCNFNLTIDLLPRIDLNLTTDLRFATDLFHNAMRPLFSSASYRADSQYPGRSPQVCEILY